MIATTQEDVLSAVRAALLAEPSLELKHDPVELRLDEGVLTLDGEVSDIATKRRFVRRAAEVPGVAWISDRLRVAAAVRNHQEFS